MNKKILIIISAVIFLAGAAFFILKSKSNTSKEAQKKGNESEMIFFYGQECPHCINVEKFLEENKVVEEKVKFEKKEVWKNKENAKFMTEKAKICGLSEESLGVPFFWDGSKCLTGDVDIINFLKNKAGIQQ